RRCDDDGQVTTASFAVAPVREEAAFVAARAAGDVLDVVVGDLSGAEERANGATEIDVSLGAFRRGDDDIRRTRGLGDLGGHVVAHLEAARADAWPDRGHLAAAAELG